jgi:hypothetical protein
MCVVFRKGAHGSRYLREPSTATAVETDSEQPLGSCNMRDILPRNALRLVHKPQTGGRNRLDSTNPLESTLFDL